MKTKKIYVASSWRNKHQQALVNELRQMGHDVYDLKNPRPSSNIKRILYGNKLDLLTPKYYAKQMDSKHNRPGNHLTHHLLRPTARRFRMGRGLANHQLHAGPRLDCPPSSDKPQD